MNTKTTHMRYFNYVAVLQIRSFFMNNENDLIFLFLFEFLTTVSFGGAGNLKAFCFLISYKKICNKSFFAMILMFMWICNVLLMFW